jgi:hypothetical protein
MSRIDHAICDFGRELPTISVWNVNQASDGIEADGAGRYECLLSNLEILQLSPHRLPLLVGVMNVGSDKERYCYSSKTREYSDSECDGTYPAFFGVAVSLSLVCGDGVQFRLDGCGNIADVRKLDF